MKPTKRDKFDEIYSAVVKYHYTDLIAPKNIAKRIWAKFGIPFDEAEIIVKILEYNIKLKELQDKKDILIEQWCKED